MDKTTTISAVATGEGGAIAVLRISGIDALPAVDNIFYSVNGKKLVDQKGFTVHYGYIRNAAHEIIDDVLVTVFKAPNSYTGEDMAEISCHASVYIKSQILKLLGTHGVIPAGRGEFTLRAFMNGKLDLSQAEAVADIISSESKISHDLAVNQIRGGYSGEIKLLRDKLVELLSLLELELDFSDEDVEFADRQTLKELIDNIRKKITYLMNSYSVGNILKNGIPIAIVGNPNAGKSTLLNRILNEEKAIVSDIPGTTRDIIEDCIDISGIKCRFIDTAGIRETDDILENMGIFRTLESISKASVVLIVSDISDNVETILETIGRSGIREDQKVLLVLNKSDNFKEEEVSIKRDVILEQIKYPAISISAKTGHNLEVLKQMMIDAVGYHGYQYGLIVTNSRHYKSLLNTNDSIGRAAESLKKGLSGDLIAEDLRTSLYHLGEITGQITSDDILHSIFSNFCIGK